MTDNLTTNQVKYESKNNNPSGKGGFGEHPENRSDGRWSKENSFTYWMNYFKHLSVDEFKKWLTNNSDEQRSVAADIAFNRVFAATKDLAEFREVADRTEGKTKLPVEHSGEVSNKIQQVEKIIDDLLADDNEETFGKDQKVS